MRVEDLEPFDEILDGSFKVTRITYNWEGYITIEGRYIDTKEPK